MLETNVIIIVVFIILFLLTIYLFGRKDGYTKGYDIGYKRATDEYERVIEENTKFIDELENRWKRDYYR